MRPRFGSPVLHPVPMAVGPRASGEFDRSPMLSPRPYFRTIQTATPYFSPRPVMETYPTPRVSSNDSYFPRGYTSFPNLLQAGEKRREVLKTCQQEKNVSSEELNELYVLDFVLKEWDSTPSIPVLFRKLQAKMTNMHDIRMHTTFLQVLKLVAAMQEDAVRNEPKASNLSILPMPRLNVPANPFKFSLGKAQQMFSLQRHATKATCDSDKMPTATMPPALPQAMKPTATLPPALQQAMKERMLPTYAQLPNENEKHVHPVGSTVLYFSQTYRKHIRAVVQEHLSFGDYKLCCKARVQASCIQHAPRDVPINVNQNSAREEKESVHDKVSEPSPVLAAVQRSEHSNSLCEIECNPSLPPTVLAATPKGIAESCSSPGSVNVRRSIGISEISREPRDEDVILNEVTDGVEAKFPVEYEKKHGGVNGCRAPRNSMVSMVDSCASAEEYSTTFTGEASAHKAEIPTADPVCFTGLRESDGEWEFETTGTQGPPRQGDEDDTGDTVQQRGDLVFRKKGASWELQTDADAATNRSSRTPSEIQFGDPLLTNGSRMSADSDALICEKIVSPTESPSRLPRGMPGNA